MTGKIIEVAFDTSARISPAEVAEFKRQLEEINRDVPGAFIDIIPIESLPEPVERIDGSDDDECFVTVYWVTPLDGYIVAGWPAPVWIVADYDELGLGPSESVRMWM